MKWKENTAEGSQFNDSDNPNIIFTNITIE